MTETASSSGRYRGKPVATLAVAVAVAALATCAGCALGHNYHRPDVQVPESIRGQSGEPDAATLADLGWWEVFADSDLQALLTEAVAANHDLKAATARVEQERQLVGVARADLLPHIDYSAQATRERSQITTTKQTFNSFLGAFSLAWEIDLWGRIRRLTEAATAEFYAAEDVRRGVLLTVSSDVATSYFELIDLDQEMAIARESADSFRETRDLFNHRFEGGIGTLLEVSRADAALSGAESQIPDIQSQITAKENQICVLLGRIPGPIERGSSLAQPAIAARIPVGLPSELLQRRPDVLQAEHDVMAANAEAGAALASFFPRFGLTSLYGGQSSELEDIVKHANYIWAVGGTLSGPLFEGGRLLASYRAQNAQLDEAVEHYSQSTVQAFGEVSSLLVSHDTLRSVRERRADQVEQLRTSVRLSLQRYRDGIASYYEVLEAQQQFFPSQVDLVRTQRDELVTMISLYRALGGGWKL